MNQCINVKFYSTFGTGAQFVSINGYQMQGSKINSEGHFVSRDGVVAEAPRAVDVVQAAVES